jgi:hypothetical protein
MKRKKWGEKHLVGFLRERSGEKKSGVMKKEKRGKC